MTKLFKVAEITIYLDDKGALRVYRMIPKSGGVVDEKFIIDDNPRTWEIDADHRLYLIEKGNPNETRN